MSTVKVNTIQDSSGSVDLLNYANGSATGIAVNSGRKNLIINGAMQVAQRGTSFATTGIYTIDRWMVHTDAATVSTQQVEDTVNGSKVATLSSTASGHTFHVLQQRLEHLRRLQGKTLTLSGWVKGTAGTHTQYIEFRDSSGTGIDSVNFPMTFTGSWQYITHTFQVPTNAAYDTNGAWFNVSFYGGDTLAISEIQLEVGSVATPFEHRSYGEELALCQRYCNVYAGSSSGKGGIVASGNRSFLGYGNAHNANNPVTFLGVPVTMRAMPTLTYSSAGHFAFDNGWTIFATYSNLNTQSFRSSPKDIALIGTTSGLSLQDAGSLSFTTTSGWMILDAEL